MADSELIEQFCQNMTAWGARFILDTQCNRFRHPALAQALAVCREHAGPDGLTNRKALNPRVMQPFLKKVALFERVEHPPGPKRWRARVTGEEFTLAYAEMSGKYLDEVLQRKFLLRWKALADFVLAWGKPVRYLTVTEAFNRDNSVLEHLLVPLMGNELSHMLLVGHFQRGAKWDTVVAEEAAFGHKAHGPGA